MEVLILPAGLLHLLSAPHISPSSNAYFQMMSRAWLPTTSAAAILVWATISLSPELLYSLPSGVPASAPAASLVSASKEQLEWLCYYVSQITPRLCLGSPRRSKNAKSFHQPSRLQPTHISLSSTLPVLQPCWVLHCCSTHIQQGPTWQVSASAFPSTWNSLLSRLAAHYNCTAHFLTSLRCALLGKPHTPLPTLLFLRSTYLHLRHGIICFFTMIFMACLSSLK